MWCQVVSWSLHRLNDGRESLVKLPLDLLTSRTGSINQGLYLGTIHGKAGLDLSRNDLGYLVLQSNRLLPRLITVG